MKKKVLFSLYVDVLYFNSKHIPKSGPFLTNYQGSFYWPIVINQTAAIRKKNNVRDISLNGWFLFSILNSWSNFRGLGSSIELKKKKKWKETKKIPTTHNLPFRDRYVCLHKHSPHKMPAEDKVYCFHDFPDETCNEKLLRLFCRISHSPIRKCFHKHYTETEYKYPRRTSPAKFNPLLKV